MPDVKGLVEKMLLSVLLALIGSFSQAVKTFILHLRAELANNADLEQVAETMISRVQEEHPDWSWHEKFVYVSQAGVDHFAEVGRDVRRALWNTIVDVKLVDMRTQSGGLPDPAARLLGSTQGGGS